MTIRNWHELNPSVDKSLPLCDPDFETASIFRRFLQLVECGQLLPPIDRVSLLGLSRFLKKWDCHATNTILLCFLRDELRAGHLPPLTVFIPAAELGCLETCMMAIDWGEDLDHGPNGFNSLDPSSWSTEDRDHVALPYQWALRRAFAADKVKLRFFKLSRGQMFEQYIKTMLRMDCQEIASRGHVQGHLDNFGRVGEQSCPLAYVWLIDPAECCLSNAVPSADQEHVWRQGA